MHHYQSEAVKTQPSLSTWSYFVQLVKSEGYSALFKGWLPNYIRLGPTTFIILIVLDKLREFANLESLS